MPSKKIIIALIICSALVFSVWLIVKIPVNVNPLKGLPTSLETYRNLPKTESDDWKKMLSVVDSNSKNFTDYTEKAALDDTTLTAQISKDFFAQYLLLKKGGKEVTEDEIEQIVNSITLSPKYNDIGRPKYTVSNIHVSLKSDTETTRQYKENMLKSIGRIEAIKTNPVIDFMGAMNENSGEPITALDTPLGVGREVIKDFLAIEVPKDAVDIHLSLLNAGSDLLADVEGMRNIFTDPIKGLFALKFQERIDRLVKAMTDLNDYFVEKLGQ